MTEPSRTEGAILDDAIAWHVALERDGADWDAYLRWLEADPRHRAAFNSVALVDSVVAEHRQSLAAAPVPVEPSPSPSTARRWWPQLGLAIAAALALILLMPLLWAPADVRTVTSQDNARVVVLGDGVRATLSPNSELAIHGDGARRLDVARGEVYFDVRHDPDRTMVVAAGRFTITDIGTRFSVNLAGRAFRLGVAEGQVDVSTARTDRPIRIRAGHQLASPGEGLAVTPVAVDDVASWRSGRLAYNDAPVTLVAADIARYTGRAVTLDPSLEHAHFSGSLVIGDGTTLLDEVASILGARVRRGDTGDRLVAAPR